MKPSLRIKTVRACVRACILDH